MIAPGIVVTPAFAMFLAAAGHAGCHAEASAQATRDSAGIRIIENARPADDSRLPWRIGSEPAVSIGEVVGAEAYLLHRANDATILPDGRIVIANTGSNELRVFDSAGVHLATWGREGEGPGEFTNLAGVASWPGDSLVAWNRWTWVISVFDAEGAFLRAIGRRGEGPMEFFGAAPMHADTSGRVHVFDPQNRRISVIDEAFTLVEETRLPARVSARASLDDGERYVVQASIEGPGRSGMPLHIIDGSGVLKSFGAGEEPDEGSWLGSIDLRLAGGPEGRMFAAHPVEYLIEAWAQEGTRVGALRGEPALNTEASLQEPPSPDNPPPSGILEIHPDSDGLLWVSLLILRPDWLQHIMWDPSGEVSSEVRPDVITRMYQPRLDVIDLETCTLVASQLHDQLLLLLDDRTVLGYGFTELGSNTLDVLRVWLDR